MGAFRTWRVRGRGTCEAINAPHGAICAITGQHWRARGRGKRNARFYHRTMALCCTP